MIGTSSPSFINKYKHFSLYMVKYIFRVMSNELKTIEVIRKEMSNYISEGRTSAFGGGTKLPMDTTDAKAQLTGNYQNILYTKEGEDKVLTLAEFKCGKITDTTAVNHNDTRLVSGTNIQVSVKEISGQFRNKIVFV